MVEYLNIWKRFVCVGGNEQTQNAQSNNEVVSYEPSKVYTGGPNTTKSSLHYT